jgi:hypothetical protein
MLTSQTWSNGIVEHPCIPVGLNTTKANSGSYFRAAVQLSIITQSILTSLHPAPATTRSAEKIRQDVAQLDERLNEWTLSLPIEINFQQPLEGASMTFARERMLLGFQLCSARMLLARPSLSTWRQACREGNKPSFARQMGDNCIEAAKVIVDFLPDDPCPRFIYDHGPWWCIVHYMMQATSVFLSGLSCPLSASQDSMLLTLYVWKAIRWLRAMHEPVAQRAYHVAVSSFESVSRQYPIDTLAKWRMDDALTKEVQQNLASSVAASSATAFTPSLSGQYCHDSLLNM